MPAKAFVRMLVAAASLVATLSASRALAGELLVMTEELQPHSSLRDGRVVGSSTEFIEALLKEAGLEYRLDLRAWNAVMQTAATQNAVLVYPIGRTAEREAAFQWIGPLGTLEHRLYKLKRRTDLHPQVLADLRGHTIAVVPRDARQIYLQQQGFAPQTELIETTDNRQAMRLLSLGRVDYAPIAAGSLDAYCRAEQLDCSQFEPTVALGMKLTLYLAANPATPRETLDKLRSAWARLVENGSYQRILKQAPPRD